MSIATYIIMGVLIGAVGLYVLALLSAKKDDAKFDANTKPKFEVRGFWEPPDGFTNNEPMWKSTTIVTTTSNKKAKNEKSLEDQLQEAVEKEEYEIAAKLRDKINKKKK